MRARSAVQATAFLLLSSAPAAPRPVTEIRIVGNRTVPDQTILYYLQNLEHEPLTDGLVERAFRRLWETGLFEDIEFRRETTPPGDAILIVEVEEKPWLDEVRFEGEALPRTRAELDEALSDAGVDLRANHPFGPEDARRAAQTLQRLLGPDYEVTFDLRHAQDIYVDLILRLEKRTRPSIAIISFGGNRALDAARLRGAMQLKPSDWTTWLTRRDRFDRQRLEADLERIRDTYRQHGFVSAVVGPARVERVDGKAHLTIPIVEGPVYLTSAIFIEPGSLIDEETVRLWLDLKPGEPYNPVAVRRTRLRIEDRYRDDGYAGVRVEVEEKLDPAAHRAELAIRVHPGRLHLFGRIELRGNDRTRGLYLRQYFRSLERDRFRASAIDADVRTLTTLGLVRSVTPETETGVESNVVDLTLHVQELPRFEYFLGGDANGVEGASAALGLMARGLLGRGETWLFDGELGNRFGNLTVTYQDPFSLGRRLLWGASFTRQRIEYPEETSDDLERFSLRFSGPGGSRFRFQSLFQRTTFRLTSTLATPVPFLTGFLGRHFQTNRLRFDFGYEGQDQPIFPTKGLEILVGAEAAGGLLGGDVGLTRLAARAQQVIPLSGSSSRHLVSLRGRAESIWPFAATKDEGLPRFERVFLGSEDDLRGFPIREIGPKTSEGVPIGGDRLVFASVEYEYLVSTRARLVGFFDLGNLCATDLPEADRPALRFDAGAELRLLAPLLNVPLRVGYGANLDRLKDEPPGRFFITLSARF